MAPSSAQSWLWLWFRGCGGFWLPFLEVFALSRGTWPGVLSLGSSPAAKTVADTITQAQVWFIHGMFGPWTMVRLCRSSGIFP